jgi:acyl-CoA synthetase (AMP-forming)/AMP-acid ligase II
MDFTVPNGVNPDIDLQLTRLVKDFHDGYLTEKGYMKKRIELLRINKLNDDNNSATNSTPISNVRSDIIPSISRLSTNQTVNSTSNSNSDYLTDDFFQASHTLTQSVDESSNTQPVFYDDEILNRYNNLKIYQDSSIRKELQKPLDPRDVSYHIDNKADFDNLAMIFRKRATLSEKEPAVLIVDEKGRESKVITWDKLYYRSEKIAKQIKNKAALYPGDRVCLIYQNVEVIDFMVAFYGCFLSGVVAVPLNSSTSTNDLVSIMKDTQSHLCLMSDSVFKYFEKQAKQAKSNIWPKGIAIWKTSEMGTYKTSKRDVGSRLKVSDLAYIDYTKAPTGEYKGVVISHRTIINQMKMLDTILSTSPDIKTPLVRSTLKPSYSKNTILSTLDVRNSIGLVISMLFSVYSGNLFIWLHSKVAEVPGLFANIISLYRSSIVLTDYFTLKSVVFNYQSFPQNTRTFSKRKVDLSCVNWCLIDTCTVDCEFNEILSDRWFKPLGNKHCKRIISPILSLNEQGGVIISMRDWYGNEDQLGCIFNKSAQIETLNDEFGDDDSNDKLSEILIDKESLSTNSVKVINDSPPNYSSSSDSNVNSNYVRVGAFGYPIPDATLALVNPETKILSGVLEVGEIWVDSNCISGGYWGLPEDTETIFQAECSDYEGILSLKFVRTGLLGFIYNGKVYVLGLYENRINQRVTWYDQYLEMTNDESKDKENDTSKTHARNISMASESEIYYKKQRKKKVHNLDVIDLSQNLSNKYLYKYHYSNHLVKTLARNLPYFKDCAFFNLKVNKEYLPVGIMESGLSTDISKAGKVELQSMLSEAFELLEKHHNVRLFFMVVTKTGALSRSMKSGRMEIANTLTKRRFLEGRLPSVYVSFKPYNSLGSIYHGEDLTGGIWSPYSTSIRKEMLSYASFQSSGLDERDSSVDDHSNMNLTDFKNPIELLEFRAKRQPDELAYAQIEGLVIKENKQLTTWKKIESKIFSLCSYFLEKKILMAGDAVILMYPLCEEYIECIFACWMAGYIVIPIEQFGTDNQSIDEDVETLVNLIKEFKVQAIFVNNDTETAFKNKPISSKLKTLAAKKGVIVPKLRNTAKHSKTSSSGKSTYKKMEQYRKTKRSKSISEPYLIWISFPLDNAYTNVKVTFKQLMHMCLSLKETCQMKGKSPLFGCSNFTQGLGFLISSVMGVYLGTTTYLMTKTEYATHTNTFFQAVERYVIENVHLDNKMFTYALRKNAMSKTNLKNMKNLMITWQNERADPLLTMKYKESIELSNIKFKNICNVLDHPLNPLISTRSYLAFEPVVLWLDPHALSQGYISIVNPKDSPNAIPVVDSGIVSVNTEVIIVNPQTEQLCKVGEYGEIWVSSEHSTDGFAGKDANITNKDYLEGKLSIADKTYLRTGEFGFLHIVNKNEKNRLIELQLLYNLGRIDETFEYCGLQFFTKDIEHCMESFDGISKCCVFKAGEYTVLIAATSSKRSLSTIAPLMTLKLLNKFKFVVDIISFVDSTGLNISRENRIQRSIIAKRWMEQKLKINATFGVSYGENEMIKAVKMQEWVEDKLTRVK